MCVTTVSVNNNSLSYTMLDVLYMKNLRHQYSFLNVNDIVKHNKHYVNMHIDGI